MVIWIDDLWAAKALGALRVIPELAQRLAPLAHQTQRLAGDLANFDRRRSDAEAAFRRALHGAPKNTAYLDNLAATVAARLMLHVFQAWVEIALHPALLVGRWQGAATLTFLALYLAAVVRKNWPR